MHNHYKGFPRRYFKRVTAVRDQRSHICYVIFAHVIRVETSQVGHAVDISDTTATAG
jgi:hypothetical protein